MGNNYQFNVQLKQYNSFQTSALAKIFFEPKTKEEIKECIRYYKEENKLVIGGGCNLFFTKDFDGIVIKPNLKGITITKETNEYIFIDVKASENWDSFVEFCVDNKYSGLENLSLIPGTVGASPVQNIGAYGTEVKDAIEKVVAIDINNYSIVEFNNEECKFAYRDSFFKQNNHYIIISVLFKLDKKFSYTPKYVDLNKYLEQINTPTLQEVRNAVIQIRKSKLPDEKSIPNAGSFFKNPYISSEIATSLQDKFHDIPLYPINNNNTIKTSAAFLIDRAGFKGKRIGNIGTYPKQALIIVNYGTNDGNEIVSFMNHIQQEVINKFGIKLEPEVRIL